MRISDWSSDVCPSDQSRRTTRNGRQRDPCDIGPPSQDARYEVFQAKRAVAVIRKADGRRFVGLGYDLMGFVNDEQGQPREQDAAKIPKQRVGLLDGHDQEQDRKSTRLNSSP